MNNNSLYGAQQMLDLHDNLKHPATYHESHSTDAPLHTQSVSSLPVVWKCLVAQTCYKLEEGTFGQQVYKEVPKPVPIYPTLYYQYMKPNSTWSGS